ncbi:uncharacterized protein SCHCODRAFT_02598331 [Schizophyllum commune H4-8]|uniref:Uncharacterized protein n=1 Tax=Schizophyllum commune (strain H4-8 / FGSC 9210) TaxID=578458 RepID=D8Q0U6_SCHCM|nr:uncharacterized protein SCHCODRAFT_02598331 [Schizophyllum commune H4-8]KAI5895152.1 hypothetical protein SCHCODRAFT_02598331 [Schizophyllum commune H4-8]
MAATTSTFNHDHDHAAPVRPSLSRSDVTMRRTLRSGNSFGIWDGEAIDVVDSQFNLAEYVKRSVEEERDELSDDENEYEYGTPDHCTGLDAQARSCPTAAAEAILPQPEGAAARACGTFDGYERPKRRTREHRKRKREAAKLTAADEADVEVRESTRRKYIDNAEPLSTGIRLTGLRVTRTGYTAMRDATLQGRPYRLDELVGPQSKFKFNLVPWNGRKPVPLLANGRLVFGCMPGRPDDSPGWDEDMKDWAKTIHETLPHLTLTSAQKEHRRGSFPATAHGHSYGGGQQQPMTISEHPKNAPHFRRIMEHPGAIRSSGFNNGATKGWAPKLHTYLRDNRRILRSRLPHLRHNFRSSVWAATTVNYGPRTATYPHKDYANLPWGWCPITALGNYDPKRGGHLVLWELGLVIEFPPRSTIIIPSGLLTHSNVSVGPNETRFSVTQYTAGAIIRWVDQQFQTKEAFLAGLSPERRAEEAAKDKTRYLRGLAMFSTLDELQARHEAKGDADEDSDLTELEDEDRDDLDV